MTATKRKTQNQNKRNEILAFIEAFRRIHPHYGPSIHEIGEACGINSKSVVNYYIHQLRDAGLVTYEENTSRSIDLPGARWFPNDDAVLDAAQRIQAERL